jgi:hypothetical protein
MVEPPFMIDELVEVSGKSGPHVVWRPGTNGEVVVACPCGGLPFEVPYQDVKRWKHADDKFSGGIPVIGVGDRAAF